MNKDIHTQQKGFALLLAIVISSIALAIGLSILQITLKQLSLGTTTKGSEIAFQTASTAIECLRFTRNASSNDFLSGSITVECFGSPQTITRSGSPSGNIYLYSYQDNLLSNGSLVCIQTDTYVLDASAGSVSYTFPNGSNKTCNNGDICTFGFARGYNQSCSQLSGNLSAVQRELTAEF